MKIVIALFISALAFNSHAADSKKKTMKAAGRTVASVEHFECGGTEPFWDMTIKGGKMEFRMFETPAVVWNIKEKLTPIGYVDTYGFVVKGENAKSSVTAFVRAGDCNDGMSEKKYSHEIMLVRGSSVFGGCCIQK